MPEPAGGNVAISAIGAGAGREPVADEPVSRADYEQIVTEYSLLQYEYEQRLNEIAELTDSAETAKAQLIKPYAWAVLHFLYAYGGAAALLLFLQGFGGVGSIYFHLNDTVVAVIVGSTAVSAIGLVLSVVRGLFPVAKAQAGRQPL